MDNIKAISSAFETALRVLLLLSEVKNRSLTITQICEIDFISVYAADFGLLDENLHGYGTYRFSEFLARKASVSKAVKSLVLRKCIRFKTSKKGYLFQITPNGLDFANKLKVSYVEEYRLAVETVVDTYRLSESHMLKEINRCTLQSLQEDTHE